jgi:hypothetical protein
MLTRTGRELYLIVQPKIDIAVAETFVNQLPKGGVDRIIRVGPDQAQHVMWSKPPDTQTIAALNSDTR